MNNVVNDIATLTTIPEKTLTKFFRKMIFCICEDVEESILAGEDVTELDIGIGTLYIKHVGGEIKYKIVPNDLLDKAVTQTVENKKNLLEDALNDSLQKKFIEVYKDLC